MTSPTGSWGWEIGSELFAPGLCAEHEYPNPFGGGRYDKGFKPNAIDGGFGCREWAYQLYDDERPYIDVTSYERKTKLDPHGTYIREFIGWARFGDKKPIIGKDSNTWICLLDCPNGEQPGIIPDIKAWASKNGWSVPKRPKKQPQFPDSDFRSRKYEFD